MSKIYHVGIVGESNYQNAIGNSYEGETVHICVEHGNPYDEEALRVENSDGDVIGYIPRSSWIHRCIYEEGKGTTAKIKTIKAAGKGLKGVVLDVGICDDVPHERQYGQRAGAPVQRSKSKGWLSRLFS